ncbi:sigma-54-dependent transcriptional regulator [Ferrimonas marina]|uniref:DNA-binding transcriptional response regulator, NtrC family, contains REC, AAA-type ATPase, and a Fis-type DNA-binding domains n=1 Tax=Ferrimonas marina TaxID=299255 RepID=A0A1M5RSN7_9GAMM|nr:sigma-54 dependent transcriptional regulator [Ferrimonas marina]SHH29256.1 DNA-binding transcriptional response regulator, NtrC family, contains REC, AAA-type ATPase, and a Fis-type DNA-binding domains [Ferrimonas marina]
MTTESHKPSVLLVEDSETLASLYQAYLAQSECEVHWVASGEAAQAYLQERTPEVMLLDLNLPDIGGLEILQWLAPQNLAISVVIITAHGSVDAALDALRLGACDFLEKPFDAQRLQVTVANALQLSRLGSTVRALQSDRYRFHGFIGKHSSMQKIYRMVETVAASKATVFITGESGTGKEVCAEAIHRQGPRAKGAFVALNCGAIPKDLMESEIFGHSKGAFTGAVSERQGAAARANGGTLFLDEIGELDLELQTKLLRFVQTGRFQKVGGSGEEQVDVRFLCATNRDPLEEVKAGRFREDLYYRLYVVPIHLPPLRERGQDVLAIATSLLQRFAKEEGKGFVRFAPAAAAAMMQHDWPGNVRELQNVVRTLCVLHEGEEVQPAQLPPMLQALVPENLAEMEWEEEAVPTVAEAPRVKIQPLWKTEKEAIELAIEHCDGNIPQAAELLEVSPSTLYRKKQSWEG